MPHAISTIAYDADHANFLARAKLLAAVKLGQAPLPAGFPKKVASGMVWDGSSFKDEEWVIRLTSEHLAEIDSALRMFRGMRIPNGYLSPETFPLPTLGPVIRDEIALDIYHGKGFAVLRGIPAHKYTEEENTVIHVGLASWLGRLRGLQDKDGDLVVRHIKDVAAIKPNIPIGTAQYTSNARAFHTNFGDIVSLYCINTSADGGASHLASLSQIYNQFLQNRLDVIRVLASDWLKLMMQYFRRLFTGYGDFRNGEVEKVLTVAQMDAMDSLEFVARKNRVSMKLQRGDTHTGTTISIGKYTSPCPRHASQSLTQVGCDRRELQRLWVRNEELSWGIPRDLHQAFYPFEAQISNGSRQTRIQSAISNTNTTHLQGAEWARGLKGTEWNASAKDGPPKLSGVEWSATKPLEGGEWTTAKLDSQNGDAVLRGHEWSIGNLRGAEWSVKKLDGREWSATMLNDKGSVSAAKLDGGEWSAARVTRDEQVAKARAAPLHGDEWAAKLKGSEWSAKKLAGSEWAAKLKGSEWTATSRKGE
ncbi:hypothetical protein EKO27_g2470 [Xylaria grammica]|uniref:TauD/TfdA-like domain-containing protein n=1 Tax=Xylaria grammica TaxID=363999 RepID=A0A439DE53_9PEZI|nr:hypothetical protein EKO27_g2470 [Xylaria grammica]